MREREYRIWDISANEWYKPDYMAYEGHVFELLITTHGELIARIVDGSITEIYHQSSFNDIGIGPYVVEDFTGLLDKNGKKIYENDIIRSNDFWPTTPEERFSVIGIVTFENGAFGYSLTYVIPSISDSNITVRRDLSECEIIGNVHENHELLYD